MTKIRYKHRKRFLMAKIVMLILFTILIAWMALSKAMGGV